jgi:thioredoxin reductase
MSRDGVSPAQLLELARAQLRPYENIALRRTKVIRIRRGGEGFAVATDAGLVEARTVLMAIGVVDELPDIEGIQDLFGRSVHVCPYCDGWEHRNAPVAALGKGDKGAGLALLLRQWTGDLVLCTNGPAEISCEDLEKLRARGINVHEAEIERLEGEEGCLRFIVFADGTRLPRRALFFSTGQHPRSTLLEELGCRYGPRGIEYDDNGRTSVPGVYVAGDVSRDVQLAIIAAAEGARAALAINRVLLGQDGGT